MKNSLYAALLSVRQWRTENSVRLAYLSVRADGKGGRPIQVYEP